MILLLPRRDAPYCVAVVCRGGAVWELLRARERRGIGGRLQVALRLVGVADVDHDSDHRRQDHERDDDEHDHLTAFVAEPAQDWFVIAHVETLPGIRRRPHAPRERLVLTLSEKRDAGAIPG